jgi:solute carrier family 25 carnitine/acylcarnitine transporter 20/29
MHIADFLASWLSSATSMAICHPLDTLRTRCQTRGHRPIEVLRREPIRNLYAGLVTPLLVGGPVNGVVFMFNESTKDQLLQLPVFQQAVEGAASPKLSMTGVVAAGSSAGFVGSLFACPVTTIRIQQQLRASITHDEVVKIARRHGSIPVKPRQSAFAVVADLYHAEGLRGLYRGISMEASAGILGRGAYFAFYEGLKRGTSATVRTYERRVMKKLNPTPQAELERSLPIMIVSGGLTSICSWFVIYPIDTIKSRVQGEAVPCSRQYSSQGNGGVGMSTAVRRMTTSSHGPGRYFSPRGLQCSKAVERLARKHQERKFWRSAAILYKARGIRGFFAGYPITACRGALMAAIMLPSFDVLKPQMRALVEKGGMH